MKYYALIKVTYDEWRHQERVYVSEDKEELMNEYISIKSNLPLYEYDKDSHLFERLDELEQPHYWLREFND